MRFACLFSSYNNYCLFDKLWFKNNKSDLEKTIIFNVDCGSNEQNIKYRNAILKPLNIVDLKVEDNKKSTQKHIQAVDSYLSENHIECDWIVLFQHDCYPEQKDFWSLLENKLSSIEKYKDKVGVVGFKVLDVPQNLNPRQDSYGRGNIINGHYGWYKDLPKEYSQAEHFVVESTAWMAVAINRKVFREHVKPDYNFCLNLWGDDISHQLNCKNICSIVFPDLIVNHDSRAKNLLGIANSPDKSTFHQTDPKAYQHHKFWKEKYGWRWGMRDGPGGTHRNPREEFGNVLQKYYGTINHVLYNRHINDGPVSIDHMMRLLK